MKRAIIVHGWSGSPEANWLPWLKAELEKDGFVVEVPAMPDADHPAIDVWVAKLGETVGHVEPETYLIGHSIGCQTILRYLSGLNGAAQITKTILVAPWIGLVNLGDDEEWAVAKPWLETPIDFAAARSHCENFGLIFSDNDPFVPLEKNQTTLQAELEAREAVVLHDQDHILGAELPEALKLILF